LLPGLGTAAGGGTGTFFFALFAVLALATLIVPRLHCRFQRMAPLVRPLPLVALLDRPG
jgi:hypothetical protein